MKVWAAVYQHKYGEDLRTFAEEAGAAAWRKAIADEWWQHTFGEGRAKPDDPDELAEKYWDWQACHGDEWFTYEACEVEGNPEE